MANLKEKYLKWLEDMGYGKNEPASDYVDELEKQNEINSNYIKILEEDKKLFLEENKRQRTDKIKFKNQNEELIATLLNIVKNYECGKTVDNKIADVLEKIKQKPIEEILKLVKK